MRYNIAYKVVSVRGNSYNSTNVVLDTPKFMKLKYKVGEVTQPVIGQLFVFDNIGAVRQYARISHDYKIMKGVAKNLVSREIKQVLGAWDFNATSLKNFWDHPEGALKETQGWVTPQNTCFCDTFKPLAVIK